MARLDAGLSLSVLRFLRHVHVGRVSPRSVGLSMNAPRERHDYVVLLDAALRDGTLDEIVGELEPPLDQYRKVREALAGFRKRQIDSVGEDPIRLSVPLKPGETAAGLDALVRRLERNGDLAPGNGSPPTRYEGALLDAVRRFQARHGLTPDSVLGKETLDELNVPWSWRIHQLELSLERLRWLGDLGNAPFLLVNIPMFELTAWASPTAAGPPAFRTGVIVGKALDTETPVFIEEMRYVVFQPYWNIPPSITRNETIPAIERDRDYLRKNDMEIVRGQGDDADPVEPSGGTLEKLSRGELRARQRPGPRNALGPIKFVFPNNQTSTRTAPPPSSYSTGLGATSVTGAFGGRRHRPRGMGVVGTGRLEPGPDYRRDERSRHHLPQGRTGATAYGGAVLFNRGSRSHVRCALRGTFTGTIRSSIGRCILKRAKSR